jgi:hypothetical protein
VGRWQPDVVITGYVLNDPEIEPNQPLQGYFHRPSWWQYSDLLRRIARAKYDWDVRRLGGGDYFRYLHAHPGKWRSVVEAFHNMADFADSEGFAVFVVIFPRIPMNDWSGYPYDEIHRKVAAAADERGLQVIDLLEAFTRFEDPSRLRRGEIDPHPSRQGHALAAETIRERLREESPELFREDSLAGPGTRP